jgi:MSHA biogenesis protein MshJ
MKLLVARTLEQFDARSIRERLLIGLTVFALTWAVWIASIGGFVLDHRAEVVTNIDQLARDLQLQSDERQRLLRADSTPTHNALQQQQTFLQHAIVVQAEELDELLTRFIPPEEVPLLLEDVLRAHDGLKLLRLSSQPAEPVLFKVNADKPAEIKIYRHPVQLEFEGGYLDVLAYLSELESSDWRLSWRKIEYAVGEYPKAQVLIEVETLSREQQWLGV